MSLDKPRKKARSVRKENEQKRRWRSLAAAAGYILAAQIECLKRRAQSETGWALTKEGLEKAIPANWRATDSPGSRTIFEESGRKSGLFGAQ
jgi:hypothetical protein